MKGEMTKMAQGRGKSGVFMFSLDTEMMWGPSEKVEIDLLQGKGKEDREAVSTILGLLEKHDISATWAMVGHLFLDHCDEATCLTAKNRESYRPSWYQDPYSDIVKDPLRYGKDVVQSILACKVPQEIGYHSFSHPVFTEIPRSMAEAELGKVQGIRREWGLEMTSFVYPQNRIAHVDLLPRYGFKIFRGEYVQRWRKDTPTLTNKMRGGMDKVIASPVDTVWREGMWEVGGSMPFWDVQVPSSVVFRAKLGLRRAIDSGKVFHIFIHPWSLFHYERLKDDLDQFLAYVASKREEGKVEVLTMGEHAKRLGSGPR